MALDVEQLFMKYNAMVFRRCQQLLKDEARAMDAMQDVFVKLVEKNNRMNDNAPSSLLYRIATNHCLNIIRDEKKLLRYNFEDEIKQEDIDPNDGNIKQAILASIANASDITDQHIAENMLNKLFRRHPESSRTIAALHYYDGMTLEEVAQHVEMSVSGVRKRLRQLRSSLKILEGVEV